MTTAPQTSSDGRRDRDEKGGVDPDGVGFLLGVAHRARRRQWEQRLTDLGLTAPQAAMLRLVTAEPALGVRDLARRLHTDPMNAQRIVETLLARELCEARPDPVDGRRRPLRPTPRGRRLAEKVAERAQDVERHLAGALPDDTYLALTSALRAVIALDTDPGRDTSV